MPSFSGACIVVSAHCSPSDKWSVPSPRAPYLLHQAGDFLVSVVFIFILHVLILDPSAFSVLFEKTVFWANNWTFSALLAIDVWVHVERVEVSWQQNTLESGLCTELIIYSGTHAPSPSYFGSFLWCSIT